MKYHRSLLALMLGTVLSAGMAFGEMFKDGETVCFLGDSITNGGRFQNKIYDYYLTRFPNQTIHLVNAGRSGDSAGGSLSRLQEDVIDKKPTTVAVMFGMNDVGRGNYVAQPDEKSKTAQRAALEGYRKNMDTLVAHIRKEAAEPKLYCITPSPFDQTVVLDKNNNQPGCNDGLALCAAIVRELAKSNHGTVVDFHDSMTRFNLQQQKKDPKFTIVGADRVHPGAPGNLMMAWLFLKTQGVPSLVSKVRVDAVAGRVTTGENADVTAVEKKDGGVTFTMLEKSLPFPVEPGAKFMLELLPIEQDLNQELLSVTGLSAGNYELRIDGSPVGQYAADALAKGINLAFNEATPQFKQAQTVARHNEQRKDAEVQARSLLNTRRWMQSHDKINVEDPAAVRAHYDSFKNKTDYSAAMTLNYINKWSQYDDLLKQAVRHENDALQSRTPVRHSFAVIPAVQNR